MNAAPLAGLILAGGFSRRMGRDKALLNLHGEPQALWTARLVSGVCAPVFVSCRRGQALDAVEEAGFACVHDTREGLGPLGGILRGAELLPDAAWLVVACDLPRLSPGVLEALVGQRDPDGLATAFLSAHDGLPEPLCAIYERAFFPLLRMALDQGLRCPRTLMIRQGARIRLLPLREAAALDNCNRPEDLEVLP
jgi:molybdenum cofactor guanylyltransferase